MFRLVCLFTCFPLIFNGDSTRLFPFGLEHNDQSVQSVDLSVRYQFFHHYYDQVRLSTAGLIVFENQSALSADEEFVGVAPNWIETDLSSSEVFSREVTLKSDASLLDRLTALVRKAFPKFSRQRMFWALLITWKQTSSDEKVNLFQTILTSNGFDSFTLFIYERMDFRARIGFSLGDAKEFFSPSIVDPTTESNVGQAGRFVFHTSEQINDVQCQSTTGLQASPFRGSIYGGYEVRLSGHCFTGDRYRVMIDGHAMEHCQVWNHLHLVCEMPMLMDSGKLRIELFEGENDEPIDSTEFFAYLPENHGELILKNYADLTYQITDPTNNHLILHFHSNNITRHYLFRLIIYDYSTQFSSDDHSLYNRTRQRIDLGLGYLNLSAIENLTIPYEQIFAVPHDSDDRVHALQISFEIAHEHEEGWLRSAVFLGAKIFTAAASLHVAYCPAWLLIQRDPKEYIKQIPACPCQVSPEPWLEEFQGFHIDDGCDGRKPWEETCIYHPKARSCYRKKSDRSWAGAQCCYDLDGRFIEHGNEGAGTLDVVSPDATSWFGKRLGMFGHFFSDFLSYWSCCRSLLVSEKMCRAYYNYRPAGSCEEVPMESIDRHGNSTFVTLNGSMLQFDGHGEFVFLSLPDFHDAEIQILLGPQGIVGFVIGFLHGKKRLQWELFPLHQQLEIYLDAHRIDLPAEQFASSILIYEDEHLKIKRQNNGTFKISFPDCPIRLRVYPDPTWEFFHLETLVERRRSSLLSSGLLGDLHGLAFPNGTRLSADQIDDEFIQSWRVTSKNSLFDHSCSRGHSLYSDPLQCQSFTVTVEPMILPPSSSSSVHLQSSIFLVSLIRFILLM